MHFTHIAAQKTQQLMTLQISSCIEYLVLTDNSLVLLLLSNFNDRIYLQ